MTGAQVREARQALGLKLITLARLAGLPPSLGSYERTGRMHVPAYGEQDRHGAVRAVLEAAGVEFVDGNPPTVRLRSLS